MFNTNSNPKDHLTTHTKAETYQCCHCNISFSTVTDLEIHMATHTDEEPYECSKCNMFIQLLMI